MNDFNWLRVRIEGNLTVTSPLHVGSGEMLATDRNAKDADDGEALVSAVCKGVDGSPYIPATTLRGVLRSRLNDATLFGVCNSANDDADNMGKLRIYDAMLPGNVKGSIEQRTGITVNPQYGVVEAHKLFTRETVATGSIFKLTVEADKLDTSGLARILGLLDSFDGEIACGVGAGGSKDQGRLKWQAQTIKVISEDALKIWCQHGDAKLPWETLQEIPQAECIAPGTLAAKTNFSIEFSSPWLIDSPEHHGKNEKDDALEFSRTQDGRAWLPASSLKGWLRGRARRILMTLLIAKNIHNNQDIVKSEQLLAEIFGSTEKAGWLVVSDAYTAQPAQTHQQSFIAIDRFTGGNSSGALYSVNAAAPAMVTGQIGWRQPHQTGGDWRLGLLAMVARDALEGDLVLGWGKARGYGQALARMALPNKTDPLPWQEIANWLTEKDKLQPHLDAFKTKITTMEAAHA